MCFRSMSAVMQPTDLRDPSAKFVLLVVCNFARNGLAWPSVQLLCKITGYDDRTVRSALSRNIEAGLLVDTGDRKGRNRSVKVYRLNLPTNSEAQISPTVSQSDVASSIDPKGERQEWRAARTPTKVWGSPKTYNSADETPTKVSVKPITLTKTPEDAYASSSPKRFRRTSRNNARGALPDDWAPPSPTTLPASTFAIVSDWSQDRWQATADAFRDYCHSGAGRFSGTGNWNREWAQWVRQACSAQRVEDRRNERPNPPIRSLSPVEERQAEDSRELDFRRLLESCLGDPAWLARSALKLSELGYDESNLGYGLIIFARFCDKPAIENKATRFRQLAMQLGYNVRWHRIEIRH